MNDKYYKILRFDGKEQYSEKKSKKNTRKENKAQNKINKNIFYPGDIYKTGSGRYLVLEVNGDKLLVTKYGNPDYVVKNTTAVGKQKIDSISEESLNEFKIKLSKIAEVFG